MKNSLMYVRVGIPATRLEMQNKPQGPLAAGALSDAVATRLSKHRPTWNTATVYQQFNTMMALVRRTKAIILVSVLVLTT